MTKSMTPVGGRRVLVRFRQGERVYEQTLVSCGKSGCWCRGRDGREIGGHGPYWYLCGAQKGRWRKVYLGLTLNTSRYVTPDGLVDWAMVDQRQTSRVNGVPRPVCDRGPAAASPGRRARPERIVSGEVMEVEDK